MRSLAQFIDENTLALLKEVDIDKLLVAKGYSYLEALVKRDNELFGGDVSEQRKELFLNEEVKTEQTKYLNKLSKICGEYESTSVDTPQVETLFEKILTDATLFQHVKKMVLHRYFRDQYAALIAPYEQYLEEAKLREYKSVCTRFGGDENEFLGSLDKLDKRRAVFNEVLEDVFSPQGFVRRATSKGFTAIHKPLSDDLATIFSPDTANLVTYFPMDGSLNIDNYLGATKKSIKNRYYNFHYPVASLAFDVYRRYRDIYSMEVAIRADGISYEAIQPKLEVEVQKYLETYDVSSELVV